jgi:hypothetical protein
MEKYPRLTRPLQELSVQGSSDNCLLKTERPRQGTIKMSELCR